MSYYSALNLKKEPFSSSPDPVFLYRSAAHNACLKRLEVTIRLKRGLSLILGDVGTGKTTLSRTLLTELSADENIIPHMILDPTYNSEFQFLEALLKIFNIKPSGRATQNYKEEIERYLYKMGVEENKTVVLLIDEGQKLSANFLEILRTLLNYETNEYKLLQLIIMSQMELLPKIKRINNFYDRIVLKYIINPFDEKETSEMIEYRIRQAGLPMDRQLFTPGAVSMIFRQTQGYPRRISIMCHNLLEEMIIEDKTIVDEDLVEKTVEREKVFNAA